MSGIVFHPDGMAGSGQHSFTRLTPGERVVPFTVLESYWAGDVSALADWAKENGLCWPQNGTPAE